MSLDFLGDSDVRRLMEVAVDYGIFRYNQKRKLWVLTKGFQKWILRESLKPNTFNVNSSFLMMELASGYMESIHVCLTSAGVDPSGSKTSWDDVTAYLGGEDKRRGFLAAIQWMCDRVGLTKMTNLVIMDLRNYSHEIGKEAALAEFIEILDELESERAREGAEC